MGEDPGLQETFYVGIMGRRYRAGRLSVPRVLPVAGWPQVHVTGAMQAQAQHLGNEVIRSWGTPKKTL